MILSFYSIKILIISHYIYHYGSFTTAKNIKSIFKKKCFDFKFKCKSLYNYLTELTLFNYVQMSGLIYKKRSLPDRIGNLYRYRIYIQLDID